MLQLLAPLLGSLANSHVKTTLRHTRNQVILYVFFTVTLLFATVFLNIIAYILLSQKLLPILAASILCLFWLFMALILLITLQIIALKRKKSYEKQMHDERNTLVIASSLVLLPSLLSHSKILGLASPLIGLLAYYMMQNDKKHK